jgi:glutathionylspermidine amidase/synthetase
MWTRLVRRWQTLRKQRLNGAPSLLHLLCDDKVDEEADALFMRAAATAAGWACKVVVGLGGLRWSQDGRGIEDADGEPITTVWKNWAWRTALAQLQREEGEAASHSHSPARLADVLLHPAITVTEPLWTLIPSSKAILAILWRLFPGHPILIETHFDVTESLRRSGYAAKPVAGRAGQNVKLLQPSPSAAAATVDAAGAQTDAADGGSSGRGSVVYQAICPLPRYGRQYVQVCPWVVGDAYAGAALRIDKKPILDYESDLCPLRVV